MIRYDDLKKLYIEQEKSMREIAKFFKCSSNKIRYWMKKHNISRRSIGDAIYLKHNPDGDPFFFQEPKDLRESKLFGLGLGIYWGEGTKADLSSVRLGNTDPKMIKLFIEFLVKFFNVSKHDMNFGLQLFNDVDLNKALNFWIRELRIKKDQFYKPIVTISGSIGTYRKKSEYGVVTLYYSNKKLRKLLGDLLEEAKFYKPV